MLHVCCSKWTPSIPYRSRFTAKHVNVLKNMVKRHCQLPHEFVCITDDDKELDADIRVVPMWKDHSEVLNPSIKGGPSCYRRLKLFSREAEQLIGKRILHLDLDVVITDDVTALWDRPDDFIIWDAGAQWGIGSPQNYNGSMFMLTAGARTCLWDEFDPKTTPRKVHDAGYRGSDQGWMAYRLRNEKTWKRDEGVLSYRKDITPNGGRLPRHAKVVIFHGKWDPWMDSTQRLSPWIRTHWR